MTSSTNKDSENAEVGTEQNEVGTEQNEVGTEQNEVGTEQNEVHDRLTQLEEQYGATWDGPDDPQDPYNWSTPWKVGIAIIMSAGQLITLLSASMVTPALNEIARDLHMSTSTVQISFSIYFLGLGFAPFLLAPLSEMYGRKMIWLMCNGWFTLWNALCPVGNSKGLMIVGRLLAASGASIGTTLTGPVMADMYRAKDRGKSLALASLLPYLGPAVGPIVGGTVSQYLQWHWLFWIVSIVNIAITITGLFLLRESYTPVLLRRKACRKSPDTSTPLSPRARLTDFLSRLRTGIARPVTLLLRRPTIQLLSIWFGLNFGIYTLMLSTYANMWIHKYNQTPTRAALNYIAIVIGMSTASQAGGPLMDFIYRRLSAHAPPRPEFRAPYMAIGVLLVPVGLFLFGWAARAHAHWAVVDVGAAIFAFGNFLFAQAQLAYLLDEFEHGASANAAARLLSHVFGFVFPIFGPAMYERLGLGWGNSVLAGVWIVVGVPAPAVLWVWGQRLRGVTWGKKD